MTPSPPPATPINIDADVLYNYVIAQQGASSITVDAATDFDLKVTFGSPGVLTMKFTGTPGAVPTYHTITLRLETDEGSVTQVLTVRVLPTSATQRVPNITTVKGVAVAPSATINMRVVTDVDADSFSAVNLPNTLTLTNAGRIRGTAPDSSGFYVVTFIATLGSYTYKRYFVFIVGRGNSDSEDAPLSFPTVDV